MAAVQAAGRVVVVVAVPHRAALVAVQVAAVAVHQLLVVVVVVVAVRAAAAPQHLGAGHPSGERSKRNKRKGGTVTAPRFRSSKREPHPG